MRQTKKQLRHTILCSILILSLIIMGISNSSIINAIAGSSDNDVTNNLSNVKISITNTSDNTPTVTDNSVVGSLSNGQHYKVTINWSIASDKYDNIVKSGDYFTIKLDDNYFSFKNSTQEYNLNYLGYNIGKWKIEDSNIKCTFTEECQRFIEVSGFFEASGYFIDENRATNTVTMGNIDLDIPMNPPATGFPYKDAPALDWNYGLITKLGNHYSNDPYMGWYIYGNYENALKLYTGQATENLENVVVKDVLPDDLIVDTIKINTPINHPKSETVLSDESAFKLPITEQFTNVNEDTVISGHSFATQSEWESYINTTPLTYGTSKDKKVALVNLGNLPGSLRMADTADEFKDKLADNYMHFSEEELNALANIHKISDSNPYPVYAFQVYLKVKSSNADGIFSKTSYDNTAYLTTNSGPNGDDEHTLNITQVGAGIQGSITKTATLTKTDESTGTPISGASFKLQYLNDSTWENYVPANASEVQVTDSNGQVIYNDLSAGTYRFVEVAAANGYDIDSVIYSQSQFVVSSADTNNYDITATNKKIQQPPSTEESSSIPDETSSTEESTPAETTSMETTSTEATSNENTSVETTTANSSSIPDESTTADSSSIPDESTEASSKDILGTASEPVNKPGDTAGSYKWYIVVAMSVLILSALFLTDKKKEII